MMFKESEISGLSPKAKWMEKHQIRIVQSLEGFTARGNDRRLAVGHGDNEEDAMVDWAVNSYNKDWRGA